MNSNCPWHNEVRTKWLPFHRWHFRKQFRYKKVFNFIWNFTDICLLEFISQQDSIGSYIYNQMVLKRLQAINWQNDGPSSYMHICLLNSLKIVCKSHDDIIKWKHFYITGPLWGESASYWWIPPTKTSDVEPCCFLWYVHEQTIVSIITKYWWPYSSMHYIL